MAALFVFTQVGGGCLQGSLLQGDPCPFLLVLPAIERAFFYPMSDWLE